MPGTRLTPKVAVVALAVAFLAGLPAATGAATRLDAPRVTTPPPTQVKVATSGDFSEKLDRLEIRRKPSRPGDVMISMAPERLPTLAAGDRLELSTELQFTVDCHKPSSRCLGKPYEYNPNIDLQMVLAAGPDDASGRDVITVGGPRHEICQQKPPNREHHCVIAFERNLPEVPADAPCLADGCYVNLVAVASNSNAHRGEFLAIGGIRPNGSIPQDRGRLNVVRFHPAGEPAGEQQRIDAATNDLLPLNQSRAVVYSAPLPNLLRGEQLVVDAKARVDISKLPYNVIVSSHLILTDSPTATVRGLAKTIATQRGEFDEGNGFNCTQDLGVCTIRKVGVLRMTGDAEKAGQPVTLYANLVTNAGPKHLKAKRTDRVVVRDGGGLTVDRFAPEARG